MGVLSVTSDDDIRIDAVRARIHAVFAGTNRLLGGAAGKQAAEVRQLVSALAAVGLGEDAVEVEGVRIETGSGALKLGQSALVQVVVTSPNERIADVLGLLSSQNGVTVERIEWVYDGFEASLPATADAMVKARRKADAIAAAAGLVVTGPLVAGAMTSGDRLMLSPAGIAVRVRGLHAHNRPAEAATAGARVALNITGAERAQVVRGDWVLHPEIHAPTAMLDAALRLLPGAPVPAPGAGLAVHLHLDRKSTRLNSSH